MFYSAKTGGFYTSEIHGDGIPDDAVEISDAVYQSLMTDQCSGKYITADDSGHPVAILPPAQMQPPPEMSPVEKLQAFLQANPDVATLIGVSQ